MSAEKAVFIHISGWFGTLRACEHVCEWARARAAVTYNKVTSFFVYKLYVERRFGFKVNSEFHGPVSRADVFSLSVWLEVLVVFLGILSGYDRV